MEQLILKYFPEIIIIVAIATILALYIILKQRDKELKSYSKDNNEIDIITKETKETKEKTNTNINTSTLVPTKREFDESIEITKKSFSIFYGLSIIVADDNAINQKVITSLLADSPIKIHTADNGQEVLDILSSHHDISIILMDAHMPVMDGFEASKAIRANHEYDGILIVALSGDTAQDDINKMKQAGMQEHLQKPLKIDEMFKIFYMYANSIGQKNSTNHSTPNSLNQEEGLQICSNDKNLYQQILLDFYNTYKNTSEDLSKNLISENLQQSSAILLDISGVAANIGANKLSDLAKEYKTIIDEQQEMDYKKINNDFISELNNVLTEIQNLS